MIKTYPATNNVAQAAFIGIIEENGVFTAMTATRSKEYKTFKGAVKFFTGTIYEGMISEVAVEDAEVAEKTKNEPEIVNESKVETDEHPALSGVGHITVQIKKVFFNVTWFDAEGKSIVEQFLLDNISNEDLLGYGGKLLFSVSAYEY